MAFDGGAVPLLNVWPDTGSNNDTGVGVMLPEQALAGSDFVSSGFGSEATPLVTRFMTLSAVGAAGTISTSDVSLPALQSDGQIKTDWDLNAFRLTVTGESVVGSSISTPNDAGLTLDLPQVTGVATAGVLGESDITLSFSLEANAGATSNISLQVELTAAAVAGTLSASGLMTLPLVDVAGVATNPAGRPTSGAMSLGAVSVSGTILPGTAASLDALLPPLSVSGTALAGSRSTASFSIPVLEVSSDGFTATVIGSGTMELAFLVEGRASPATAVPAYLLPEVAGDVAISSRAMVLNTGNFALTLYENFPFNSMAKFAGSYIALASDGVYTLGGSTDNGTGIQAVFATGHLAGEIAEVKRIAQAFVLYDADGSLELRVKTDDNEWNAYVMQPSKPGGHYVNRVKLGRGAKGSVFKFEVRNLSGANFGVDGIRLPIERLSRRAS